MKEFAYIHEEDTLPEPLDKIPFFESFHDGHLNDILYSSYFIQADPGDAIIKEGQDDARIFILLAGKMEVTKGGETIAKISANSPSSATRNAPPPSSPRPTPFASSSIRNSSMKSKPPRKTPATTPPSTASFPASSPRV